MKLGLSGAAASPAVECSRPQSSWGKHIGTAWCTICTRQFQLQANEPCTPPPGWRRPVWWPLSRICAWHIRARAGRCTCSWRHRARPRHHHPSPERGCLPPTITPKSVPSTCFIWVNCKEPEAGLYFLRLVFASKLWCRQHGVCMNCFSCCLVISLLGMFGHSFGHGARIYLQ